MDLGCEKMNIYVFISTKNKKKDFRNNISHGQDCNVWALYRNGTPRRKMVHEQRWHRQRNTLQRFTVSRCIHSFLFTFLKLITDDFKLHRVIKKLSSFVDYFILLQIDIYKRFFSFQKLDFLFCYVSQIFLESFKY